MKMLQLLNQNRKLRSVGLFEVVMLVVHHYFDHFTHLKVVSFYAIRVASWVRSFLTYQFLYIVLQVFVFKKIKKHFSYFYKMLICILIWLFVLKFCFTSNYLSVIILAWAWTLWIIKLFFFILRLAYLWKFVLFNNI